MRTFISLHIHAMQLRFCCMYLLLSILVPNYLHGLVVVCLAGGEKDGTVGNEGV